ncbi:MAG TPA: hypothetical protein DCS88_14625, partial [Alphaproteobacteria bacterium]|nr:hypothetical protein [Alphaproteobacteria bacterium]
MRKDLPVGENGHTRYLLRRLLGPWSGTSHNPDPGRPRLLYVEAMEPRFLLSGEGLMLPPAPPPQEDAQEVLLSQPVATGDAVLSVEAGNPDKIAVPSSATEKANEIVFVDPNVQDYGSLLTQALQSRAQQSQPGRVEVVLLDPTRDGIDQMTQWLDGHQGLQAIHVLSHGDIAALRLGITTLNLANLESYRQQLQSWNAAMAPGADLMFYGCDVAAGVEGGAFIDRIGQLTGADVAASKDASGSVGSGGDWILEKATGAIEAASFSAPGYDHLLAAVVPNKTLDLNATVSSTAPFVAAGRLGLQLDAFEELSYTMPMVDLSFASLLKTNDGRSLGDILSFKTTANTTVLDDYLAQAGSHSMSGLMDRLGDYLNGMGVYSHLESLVDNTAGTRTIHFTENGDTLGVDLTLSREFVQRFGFGEDLKPLGFDFQTGQGIPLVADIHYAATYDFDAGTIAINTLDAQIKAKSSTLNVGAVLGILDVTATGKMTFDTGKIEFSAIDAVDSSGIKIPSDDDYTELFAVDPASAHSVKANLSMDLSGALGATNLSVLGGGTPHVDVVFGSLTVDSRSTPSLLPVLTGNASLDAGQLLSVVVGGATYAVTPNASGAWSLDLSTNPVPTLGALTLANGQSYTVTATIKQGVVVTATVTGDLTIDSGLSASTVTGVNTSAESWDAVTLKPLTVASSNFSQLQAFSSLNSTQLVKMLQDLGTYLELLRDSGKFDAQLPFTQLALGNALDFSSAVNDVIDNHLATTLISGITASKAISPTIAPVNPLLPMIAGNCAFDLYVQRPGDERTSVVTISVGQLETASFTHINQLAELIGSKIATAVNGWLAWPGDLFEVEESLQGGATLVGADKTSEEQILKVHAASGSYQLKLGAGGDLTGLIPVSATPIEVQNALESVLGAGKVVVTGRPKHYAVQFIGSLAESDVQSLVVVPGADVTTGSLIDVSASEFSRGTDGKIWGKITLAQANPGDFDVLRIVPSSTVSVKQIAAGSDTSEAIQRLTIVHGGGSSFYLKGTNANNVGFTTAAIAANAGTAAIATALAGALPGVTGLSVTDVSSDYAADNGTFVYEIGFGKKDATNYGTYPTMTVDTTTAGVWTSAVPAQGVLATQQQAAAAVGAVAAHNEIQRLSIANASGGSFVIGVSLGTLFYQSDPITLGCSAATLQTALITLFKQGNPDFSASDISVTAVAGKSNTFDIEFKGIWAAKDCPQMRLNTHGLTSAAGESFGPITRLGMQAEGQDLAVNSVTTFVTFNEMMDRFQNAVNGMLPAGTSFAVNPRFDAVTKSLMFDVKLTPDAAVHAVLLQFSDGVGDLSALSTQTTLDLSTQASFQSTIGFDFANLNSFALRAGGAMTGTLTAKAADTSAVKILLNDGTFSLAFDGESYDLTLTQASTADNTTRANLVSDLQSVLANKTVASGGLLERLGYANLGQLVTVGQDANQQLQFTIKATLNTVKLAVNPLVGVLPNPMSGTLGFKSATAYPAPKAVTLPSNGRLSATATFDLLIDQSDAVTITLASDAGNANTNDLVNDLNAAFAATSITGHSYLGTGAGGKGFSTLSDAVKAILRNNQIEIVTLSPKLASLQVMVDGRDPATNELGFTPGQFANTTGAYVFLIDPVLGGQYSAVVHGQVGATPATLATLGQATLGMLNLTFANLGADYQGSLRFDLRNGLAGVAGERISL